jgi:hypothetical protein
VHLALQECPASLQVAQQAVGFVLGDDADPPDAEFRQFDSAKSMMRNLPPK